jgi:hypothetical protein
MLIRDESESYTNLIVGDDYGDNYDNDNSLFEFNYCVACIWSTGYLST